MSLPAAAPQHRLLTLVVAVYNLEHYIRECLESILRQRDSDAVELIVVDDGSTDGTAMELDAVLAAYPGRGVRVITQENAGLSAARNAGILQAHAPYLGFVDGDDMLAADFLAQVLPVLRAGRADLVEFDVGVVSDAGRPVSTLTLVRPGGAGEHAVDAAALRDFVDTYEAFAWARVYRRSLWAGVCFPPGRQYEDSATVPQLYLRAGVTHRLAVPLYCYRRRSGSITSVATLRSVRDLARNAEEALSRCDGGPHSEFWLQMFYRGFAHTCSQNVRVDATAYDAALQVVAGLAQQYRAFQARNGRAYPYRRLDDFRWRIRLARMVFRAKRVVKRLIGRELRPRDALPAGARRPPVPPEALRAMRPKR